MNYYEAEKLKDIVKFDNDEFQKKILLKNDESMFLIFALKEGQFIGTHVSHKDAVIYILEGEVKFDMYEENKKDYILKTGDILKLKKMDKHSVIAKKNSKFIVVRI